MSEPEIWAITDGKTGMANQAAGLAEAIARTHENYQVVEQTIEPTRLWSLLPAGMWPRWVSGNRGNLLVPPWPIIVVSCGRHAIGPALWIKRQSGGRTIIIHAQHPRTAAAEFEINKTQY